ncbi:MAG: hypothetical protein JKY49_09345 [Cohaesibacteraceae bacterium]|nr:hypothetical protein [Cohaesibacteraceae bacterium]PCH81189.1 MAG: hypothetical protein COB90_05255 [Hyphomicrobiales bacterium]
MNIDYPHIKANTLGYLLDSGEVLNIQCRARDCRHHKDLDVRWMIKYANKKGFEGFNYPTLHKDLVELFNFKCSKCGKSDIGFSQRAMK